MPEMPNPGRLTFTCSARVTAPLSGISELEKGVVSGSGVIMARPSSWRTIMRR